MGWKLGLKFSCDNWNEKAGLAIFGTNFENRGHTAQFLGLRKTLLRSMFQTQ